MDRRNVLVAGIAALAAAPALAQQTQTSTSSSGSASASASATTQMGQDEQRYAMQTAEAGMVALETSKVAQQKARNDMVKMFAGFEVEEQTGVAAILKEMMPDMAPPKLSGDKAQMVEKMRDTQAGADFDRMYVEGQIAGHQDLLKAQESYISGARNMHVKHIAMLARGRIQEHIAELQTMQKSMKS